MGRAHIPMFMGGVVKVGAYVATRVILSTEPMDVSLLTALVFLVMWPMDLLQVSLGLRGGALLRRLEQERADR